MSHLETLTWQVGNWKHVVFFPSLGPIGQFHKAYFFLNCRRVYLEGFGGQMVAL